MNFFKIFLILFFFTIVHKNAYSKIEVEANQVILQDHFSGEILYEKEADDKIYPASMTKIMTTIVTFDLLKKGETSLDEMITISEKAWRMSQSGYSSMFIMLNDQVSVEDLLKGIIIVSGNDACVALAEGLSGTEEDFVILMNEKAKEIGMENTNFGNSSGPVTNIEVKKKIQPKGLYFTRPVMGQYLSTEDEISEGAEKLFEKIKLGKVKIEIFKKYKLEDVIQAHKDLEARKIIGPAVIIP